VPTNLFLGTDNSNDDKIVTLLKSKNIHFQKLDHIELKIAEALSSNKIVAHFYGRSEYGPRALGNRSIFAPATNYSINESLNKKLKRTEFMPFAPIVLFEDANEMFLNWNENEYNSRFMTITYNVTDKMKEIAPAVVHIDSTARPQIIKKCDNERVYNILNEYKKITNIPVLINTSFNLHEEPIVNTPEDALKVLKQKAVDVLIINNFFIEKQ
jgi:carbamoyltransferase